MAFLTMPSSAYKQSFIQHVCESQREGRWSNTDLEWLNTHFEEFLQSLRDRFHHPKPDHVPETIYWLVEDGAFVGRLSLRHRLNPAQEQFGRHMGYEIHPSKRQRGYGKLILKLGLDKAREHGLARVLLTCDDDNLASAKIIEANGSILQDIIEMADYPAKVRRYWIEVDSSA